MAYREYETLAGKVQGGQSLTQDEKNRLYAYSRNATPENREAITSLLQADVQTRTVGRSPDVSGIRVSGRDVTLSTSDPVYNRAVEVIREGALKNAKVKEDYRPKGMIWEIRDKNLASLKQHKTNKTVETFFSKVRTISEPVAKPMTQIASEKIQNADLTRFKPVGFMGEISYKRFFGTQGIYEGVKKQQERQRNIVDWDKQFSSIGAYNDPSIPQQVGKHVALVVSGARFYDIGSGLASSADKAQLSFRSFVNPETRGYTARAFKENVGTTKEALKTTAKDPYAWVEMGTMALLPIGFKSIRYNITKSQINSVPVVKTLRVDQEATITTQGRQRVSFYPETNEGFLTGRKISIGGGIDKGETLTKALQKELRQETGTNLWDWENVKFRGKVVNPMETEFVFTGTPKPYTLAKVNLKGDIAKGLTQPKKVYTTPDLSILGYPSRKIIVSPPKLKLRLVKYEDVLNWNPNPANPRQFKGLRSTEWSTMKWLKTGEPPQTLDFMITKVGGKAVVKPKANLPVFDIQRRGQIIKYQRNTRGQFTNAVDEILGGMHSRYNVPMERTLAPLKNQKKNLLVSGAGGDPSKAYATPRFMNYGILDPFKRRAKAERLFFQPPASSTGELGYGGYSYALGGGEKPLGWKFGTKRPTFNVAYGESKLVQLGSKAFTGKESEYVYYGWVERAKQPITRFYIEDKVLRVQPMKLVGGASAQDLGFSQLQLKQFSQARNTLFSDTATKSMKIKALSDIKNISGLDYSEQFYSYVNPAYAPYSLAFGKKIFGGSGREAYKEPSYLYFGEKYNEPKSIEPYKPIKYNPKPYIYRYGGGGYGGSYPIPTTPEYPPTKYPPSVRNPPPFYPKTTPLPLGIEGFERAKPRRKKGRRRMFYTSNLFGEFIGFKTPRGKAFGKFTGFEPRGRLF